MNSRESVTRSAIVPPLDAVIRIWCAARIAVASSVPNREGVRLGRIYQ
jgi:hypothetical protein